MTNHHADRWFSDRSVGGQELETTCWSVGCSVKDLKRTSIRCDAMVRKCCCCEAEESWKSANVGTD